MSKKKEMIKNDNYNHSVHDETAVQKRLPCLCVLYIYDLQ